MDKWLRNPNVVKVCRPYAGHYAMGGCPYGREHGKYFFSGLKGANDQ